MSAIILTQTIIQDMIPSSSSWFTAVHFNMAHYPGTFKSNMKVPGNGKDELKKNKKQNQSSHSKNLRKKKITNPDTIKL